MRLESGPISDEWMTGDVSLSIAEALREAQHQKRMTGQELAGELDVSRSTVHRWTTGARLPSRRHLAKLADVLDVDIDALSGSSVALGSLGPGSVFPGE